MRAGQVLGQGGNSGNSSDPPDRVQLMDGPDYYRTRTAQDSEVAGHGIGLALTRRIVAAHGAQIGVRSTPGEGSTFTLRFPLEAPEAS